MLSNDRDEIWFICNRHVLTYSLLPDELALRLLIKGTARHRMALV